MPTDNLERWAATGAVESRPAAKMRHRLIGAVLVVLASYGLVRGAGDWLETETNMPAVQNNLEAVPAVPFAEAEVRLVPPAPPLTDTADPEIGSFMPPAGRTPSLQAEHTTSSRVLGPARLPLEPIAPLDVSANASFATITWLGERPAKPEQLETSEPQNDSWQATAEALVKIVVDAGSQEISIDQEGRRYVIDVKKPDLGYDIISHTSCLSTIWTQGAPVQETEPCMGFWNEEGKLKDRVKRDFLYPLLEQSRCVEDAFARAALIIEDEYRQAYRLDGAEIEVKLSDFQSSVEEAALVGDYFEGVNFRLIASRCEAPKGQWLP